jgi:hypothetical protein
MSISYQPKDSSVQAQQLKVQELVLQSSDTQIVSISGSDTVISLGEVLDYNAKNGVKVALLCDNSAGTVTKIALANIEYPESFNTATPPVATPTVPGGSQIKLVGVNLSSDVNDVLVLKYIV